MTGADAFARYAGRVYANAGNPALLALVPEQAARVLDVGCGAGDNARLLARTGRELWGLTASAAEAERARAWCSAVWVCDLERELPRELPRALDAILCSHVLEHLARPVHVLRELSSHLAPGGVIVAAVPNMAHWRTRARLLLGDLRRTDDGPLDRTHLQFFSYHTLLEPFEQAGLELVRHTGEFALPQWPLRRVAPGVAARVDRALGPLVPNLAASQVLIVARAPGAGAR